MSGVLPEWAFAGAAPDDGELPDGWSEAALTELVVHSLCGDWGRDDGPQEGELVRVGVLRGADFRRWDEERGAGAAVRRVPPASLARRRLAPGDIVIEASGGSPRQPVGRTLLIGAADLERAPLPWICTNFCRQLRIHPEIDPGFVQMVLAHQYHGGAFERFQTQTTNLRNLDFEGFLAGVTLPLPPLAEQRRITARVAELLGRIARVRAGLARVPEVLRRLRQTALAAACSGRLELEPAEAETPAAAVSSDRETAASASCDWNAALAAARRRRREEYEQRCRAAQAEGRRRPRRPANLAPAPWRVPGPLALPAVPPGWKLVALGDVLSHIQQSTSVRAGAGVRGIAMLRMGNIQGGRLDLSDLKHVDPSEVEVEAYLLRPGDLLFNRTNSPELVGKAAVFDADLPAVFASYLIRLTCDPELADSRYVAGWINSPWGRKWARAVRTDCVSQSNINAAQLLAMPLPLPPLAEQRRIVARLDRLFAHADEVEARVAAAVAGAEELAQTVVARALGGRLVATEAALARLEGREWETGAALISRLRAERGMPHPGPWPRPLPVRRRRRPKRQGTGADRDRAALAAPAAEEWVLAVIRKVCWRAGPMSEEDLLRRAARHLGVRLNRATRPLLARHLATALERRIVAREDDQLRGATPTFSSYSYDFLTECLRQVMREGEERERAELTREVAVRLGYSQVTAAMRDRMEEVFRTGIWSGLVGARGSRVWWQD